MKNNVKMLLLLTVFICSCCTANAADNSDIIGTLSFNPAPPFWPGEHVDITAHVEGRLNDGPIGPIPGASVLIRGEPGLRYGGITDNDGNVKTVYVIPNYYYDFLGVQRPWDGTQGINFGGTVEFNGNMYMILDGYCGVLPKPPETSVPEFPSIALPVVAVLGMIAIIGRRKE